MKHSQITFHQLTFILINMFFKVLQVPLHHAAEYGHLACLEALLRQGADVNSATSEGWTALHSAAVYGHTPCVEALIR